MGSKGSQKHSPNKKKNGFIVPPEAKIFRPTEEEFKNPLEYISKIRPLAETTGVCKIIPPPNWKTPFSLDIEHFKFSARIQKLNLLNGNNRVKLNFLEQLFQFWELQGTFLTIPEVDGETLDLCDLHKLTREYHKKTNQIKWNEVVTKMGFDAKTNIVNTIKLHFEQILIPFIKFNSLAEMQSEKIGFKTDVVYEIESDEDSSSSTKEVLKDDDCIIINDDDDDDVAQKPNVYRELKRLRFLGAGPKNESLSNKRRRQHKTVSYNYDEVEYTCCECDGKGDEASILICRGCNDKYHFTCLKPSLPTFPKHKWKCFKCTAIEISKPSDDFGFEQAKEETSIFEFGEMADNFKSNHFKCPPEKVPAEDVEKEYWKIVSNVEKEVVVRYGADLHAVDNGSGFPTSACINLQPGDVEYVSCGWNLNNLPVLKNSVLRYINSDVSGMKIPWMYVGMCFATFCWHNEDHWMFSINYLHWGEPKIWYGVPGNAAEAFESTMKREFPELFESQPDILHQLVTVMNPNILMKAKVPVYKLSQNEGEFVITFPRAYHMGFNQGFNFAEAVNFAPADWFKMGRDAVLNYAQIKRFCVFSHDELLCTIASSIEKLTPVLASAIQPDMEYIIKKEQKLRKSLHDDGIVATERTQLEFLPDDRRHCDFCKTTCYISAVSCSCNDEIVACLEHYNSLCKCSKSKQVLRIRYTMDEMQTLLTNINTVLAKYDIWLEKAENALNQNCKTTNYDIQELLNEADTEDYPDYSLRTSLMKVVGHEIQI